MALDNGKIDELSVEVTADIDKFGQQIDSIVGKTKDLDQATTGLTEDTEDLGASYVALAAAATVAFYKITGAISDAIQVSIEYNSVMTGLQSIVEGTGGSMKKAQQFVEEFTADSLVPAADAALGLKNLLARGYTEEQASEVLYRLKDAAAFGRQANLDLGEAIATATEGLKNENSVLVDNAGVTKNVAKMWDDYAKGIGKNSQELTQQEKIQAEVLGIMQETQFQVGDAAKLSDSAAGAQQRWNKAVTDFKLAMGNMCQPMLEVQNAGTGVLEVLTSIMNIAPGLATAFVTAAVAITGLVAAMGAAKLASARLGIEIASLGTALKTFVASNPWLFVAGLAVGVISGIITAVNGWKASQEELNAEMAETNRMLSGDVTADDIGALEERTQRVKDLTVEYADIQAQIDDINSKSYSNVAIRNQDLADLKDRQADITDELERYQVSVDNTAEGIERYNTALAQAKYGTEEQVAAELDLIAAEKARLDSIEASIAIMKSSTATAAQKQQAEQNLGNEYKQFSRDVAGNIDAIERETTNRRHSNKAAYDALAASVKLAQAKSNERAEHYKNSMVVQIMSGVYSRMADAADAAGNRIVASFARARLSMLNALTTAKSLMSVLQGGGGGYEGLTAPASIPAAIGGSGRSGGGGGGGGSYQNMALDAAKKQLDYEREMGRLSLEDELARLEESRRNHARTADKIMQLDREIYKLKQELRERDLEDIKTKSDQAIAAINNELENIKTYGTPEETITLTIDAESRISDVLKQELTNIQGLKQKAYEQAEELGKEGFRREMAALDSQYSETYSRLEEQERKLFELKNKALDDELKALKDNSDKQIAEMERRNRELISKATERSNETISLAREEYEQQVAYINETLDARVNALNAELKALEDSRRAKEALEEDEADKKQLKDLREFIEYENDPESIRRAQAELKNLEAAIAKRQDDRKYQQKRDSIRAEIEAVKEQADTERNYATATRDNKVKVAQEQLESYKKLLETELEDFTATEDAKYKKAEENAVQLRIMLANNQKNVLADILAMAPKYAHAGQSLGSRFASAFNPYLDSIQRRIDSLRSQLEDLGVSTSSGESYISNMAAGSRSLSVNQYFNTPTASSGEVYMAGIQAGQALLNS